MLSRRDNIRQVEASISIHWRFPCCGSYWSSIRHRHWHAKQGSVDWQMNIVCNSSLPHGFLLCQLTDGTNMVADADKRGQNFGKERGKNFGKAVVGWTLLAIFPKCPSLLINKCSVVCCQFIILPFKWLLLVTVLSAHRLLLVALLCCLLTELSC